MTNYIKCYSCSSKGIENKCYITGYDTKCGHDMGWALT